MNIIKKIYINVHFELLKQINLMSKSTGTSTCTNKCITVPVDKLVHNVKYI